MYKLLDAPWSVVQDALAYLAKRDLTTYDALIKDELAGLLLASLHGAPPQGSPYTGGVKHVLEVRPDGSEAIDAGGVRMRVTPIQKLRTVTVQTGFRRGVGGWEPLPELVDVSFARGGKRWYPGVEYMGEGIFMRLGENDGWANMLEGGAAGAWLGMLDGHDRRRYRQSQ